MVLNNDGKDHMRIEEVLQRVKKRGISYKPEKEGWLTGLVTYCIGTAFYNMLLREKLEGKICERKTRKKM